MWCKQETCRRTKKALLEMLLELQFVEDSDLVSEKILLLFAHITWKYGLTVLFCQSRLNGLV